MGDPALVIEVGRLREVVAALVEAVKELTAAVKDKK